MFVYWTWKLSLLLSAREREIERGYGLSCEVGKTIWADGNELDDVAPNGQIEASRGPNLHKCGTSP